MADRPNATLKYLTGADVRVWRLSRGYSYKTAGALLGISAQGMANLEKTGAGRKEALAMSALNGGLEPYKPTAAEIAQAAALDRPTKP